MNLFRPLPKPGVFVLPAAIALWTTLGILSFAIFTWVKHESGFHALWRRLWQSEMQFWLPVFILFGVLAGGIHYCLLRACCRKKERPFGIAEFAVVLSAMTLVAIYPGHQVWRGFERGKIVNTLVQFKLTADLESLVKNSENREAVRRMEEACREYQDLLKNGLPEDLEHWPRRFGGNGAGYFFCTLNLGWDTLVLNMPYGVIRYLDGPSSGSYDIGLAQPEQWRPLGLEMAASDAPIIRVLGIWLLEDRERFVEEIYHLYDSGDKSFRALSDLVSLWHDPDLHRAITRLLASGPWPEKRGSDYQGITEEDSIQAIHMKAIRLVYRGESLREIAPDLRKLLQRLHDFPKHESYVRRNHELAVKPQFNDLDALISEGDVHGAVRWLETACRNHLENRELLDDEFPLLACESRTRIQRYPYVWPEESYELNIPMPLKRHLIKKHSNDEERENMNTLARGMTDSEVPILRILGYWMLDDKKSFAREVYREFDSGDETYRRLNAETIFRHDPDHLRVIRRVLAFDMPDDEDPIPYREMNRVAMIHMLACGIVYTGAEIGEDAEAMRPLIRQYASQPTPDRQLLRDIESNKLFRMRSNHQGMMRALVEKGDTEGLVRMMETACRNFRDSREKLGDDIQLVESDSLFDRTFGHLRQADETFSHNIPPLVLSQIREFTNSAPRIRASDGEFHIYFDKSLPDDQKYEDNGRTILKDPEKSHAFVVRLSESEVPILRAVGYFLLGDRPNFIATVYQAHDSGDATFESLRRLVEENMDNKRANPPPEPAQE